MRHIPMEWNAEYVVAEEDGEKIKCDYEAEIIEIVEGYPIYVGRIMKLERFYIPFKVRGKLISKGFLHNKYEYIEKKLEIIAIELRQAPGEGEWTFLCNSKELYVKLMETFSKALKVDKESGSIGRLDSRAEQFVKKAVDESGAKRKFLSYVVNIHKHSNSSEDNDKIYEKFQFPYDVWSCDCSAYRGNYDRHILFDEGEDRCFIIECIGFDELYNSIEKMLPQNIKKTKEQIMETRKKEELKQQQKKEINAVRIRQQEIIKDYGKNFERKEAVLKDYMLSANEKNLSSLVSQVKQEIKCWNEWADKKLIEKEWGIQYAEILSEKLSILEKKYYAHENELLERQHGIIADKKIELLEQVRYIRSDCLQDGEILYKNYTEVHNRLEKQLKKSLFQNEGLRLHQYIQFYRLGSILIRDQMNWVNKNPLKRIYIPPKDIEDAMVYFYETDTLEHAVELRKRKNYVENGKIGEIGEREVDYTLKWLDKSYTIVPKKFSRKYDRNVIVIFNPDFIEEEQEYDHIVIGKQGVFFIETKNYSGELVIDSSGNWIRIRKDGTREGERNPIQQFRQHEKLLKSVLHDDIPVIGLLCMSHPKIIINGIENCVIPIVKSDLLTEFIENYACGSRGLSSSQIKECLNCIEHYMI